MTDLPRPPQTRPATPADAAPAEAAAPLPAYFRPEPATGAPLRELSVLEQMYGYYDAA
ncbi:MAG: hypothetical protein H5U17_14405 [Defluviimonas sp.]|nr:hypothetical protein [Defluviimonas sp.]